MNLEEQRQYILSGAMYNDLTKELIEAREKTVILTNEYNNSFGQPSDKREAILRKLVTYSHPLRGGGFSLKSPMSTVSTSYPRVSHGFV